MNKSSQLFTLGAALFAATALTTHAQTWKTVDNFQYMDIAGCRAQGSDIGTDPQGNLYAVGGVSLDANDVNRLAVVNVSYDHGTNWATLHQPQEILSNWEHNRAFASTLEVTPDGRQKTRLFVGGNGSSVGQPSESGSWYIRESVDGGTNWTTTDALRWDYAGCADIAVHPVTGDVYAGGSSATYGRIVRKRAAGASQFTTVYSTGPSDIGSGWSIAFHPNGSVFVAGDKVASDTRAMSWVVLRSAYGDAGTWQSVDTFNTTEWTGISARGCLVTASGDIYVSGWAYNSKTHKYQWIVRTSADSGNTWSISDNFSYGGDSVQVFEITQDAAGNFYVCGQAQDSAGKVFWLVRKGTPTTTMVKQGKKLVPVTTVAWTTSDAYQLAPGMSALPLGITVDASGNVFACGRAADAGGVDHWIVRRLTP